MPQSEEVKKEQARLRMKKMRNKGKTETDNVTLGVTQYPAIIHAITDPIKRRKLEAITESLKEFNQEKNVRYGVYGPTFDVVGDLLEATK